MQLFGCSVTMHALSHDIFTTLATWRMGDSSFTRGGPLPDDHEPAVCPISALSSAVEQDLLTLHPSHRTLCAFVDVASRRAGVGSQHHKVSSSMTCDKQDACWMAYQTAVVTQLYASLSPFDSCRGHVRQHVVHYSTQCCAPVGQTESLT